MPANTINDSATPGKRASCGGRPARLPLALRLSLSLFLLVGLAGLAGCQSGSESGVSSVAEPQKKAFSLEKGRKVLVLPFECEILGGNYAEATELVQKTFAGWTLYALQEAGVHADVYVPERTASSIQAGQSGRYAQQGGPGAPETYLPLTPDSRLSRSASGNLNAVPLHNGQWERSDFAGELTAGDLAGREYADDHVVSSGTVLLSPPSESQNGSGAAPTALGAEDAPPAQAAGANGEVPGEGGQPDTRAESDRAKALKMAAEKGYDYVLAGNVIFLHSEVKPIQNAGKRSATTVRGEFASTYRLLEPEEGGIVASGAITGKAGKYVSLGNGVYNDSTINNAVSRVLNQTMSATARNMTAKMMNPEARFYNGVLDSMESDEEYYRDSPGKMRRN